MAYRLNGGPDMSVYKVTIEGMRPAQISREQAFKLSNAPKQIKRMLATEGWLIVVQQGGRGRRTLISTESFEAAMQRLARGEQPPKMRCEKR